MMDAMDWCLIVVLGALAFALVKWWVTYKRNN